MKSLAFVLGLLALFAGCKTVEKDKSDLPSAITPKFEKVRTIYEVQDSKTYARQGFLEKIEYSDGSTVYWVTGLDRDLRLGYILPNGAAYQYEWVAGRRAREPRFLGADTYSASARRILGYGHPVRLEEISIHDLLKETERRPGAAKPAAVAAEEAESEEEE